jgi:hypothetical protein
MNGPTLRLNIFASPTAVTGRKDVQSIPTRNLNVDPLLNPRLGEDTMATRTTIALSTLDPKYCLDPHIGAVALVGIVVPRGGTLISPDPTRALSSLALEVCDQESAVWTHVSNHPNLTVGWSAHPEENGCWFYGWSVENNDELLGRSFKFAFEWTGDGPHVAETVISTRRGCGQPGPATATHGVRPWVEVGLALPSAAAERGHSFWVCEGDGSWNYVQNSAPAYLIVGWKTEGAAGWPRIPGHNYWGLDAINEHSVSARYIRVSVDAP